MSGAPPLPQRPILQARKLRKDYHAGTARTRVLADVDLTVARGEFLAITGPSGCGKTTLLNCLSGLDDVDAGIVDFEGVDLARMGDGARTRHRASTMGFVFQSFNLVPVLTIEQNVALPLLFVGLGPRKARPKVVDALRTVGLLDHAKKFPHQLSGGQQQRVAIARALVNSPRILWADEPTGNLDSANAKAILEELLRLRRERQLTLVVVTHSPEVAAAADRIIRMDSGRVATGAAA